MDAVKSHLIYRFHGFVLDVRNRRLRNAAGHEIKLSSRAFDTLVELLQHRGETLSKDHLMDTVWRGLVVEENNINQAICVVRKALGDSTGEPSFIKTVSGKGFCFVAEVDAETVPEEVSERPAEQVDAGTEAEAQAIPARSTVAHATPTLEHGATRGSWPNWTWLKAGATAVAAALAMLVIFFDTQGMQDVAEQAALGQSPVLDGAAGLDDQRVIPDSLAVMPFVNLNKNSASDLFALGLHDELINQLAKVENLKVISRDSVITAVESGASLFDMADSLRVETLLTGSILAADERTRINLQMLNAETGVALWGKSFEVDTRSLSDMLSAQGDIALKVVMALEKETRLPEPESLASLPTQSFKAHRYYLTARNSYNHQDEEAKWVLLSKALELDPDFADAHLMFANINVALAVTPMEGYTHEEHLQLALGSVDSYIRLVPEDPRGYALKAGVLAARGDWQASAEHLAMMDRLGADVVDMKYGALIRMSLADFDAAVRIYEETLIAEPSNLYVRGLLMAAHEMAGNQHGARQEYALGNELKSAWWGRTVNVLLTLGRREELDPSNTLDDFSPELRHLLKNLDDIEAVRRGVTQYRELGGKNAKEDVFYSALAAYAGDKELANLLLRVSLEKVSTSIFWAWLPVFAEVRATPEFRQLLVDAGLIEYWQQHGWPKQCQPNHDGSFSCQ